jgi:hypothetical protein
MKEEKSTEGEIKAIALVSALGAKLIQKGIMTKEDWDEICVSADVIKYIELFEQQQKELR